jgi:hypothetical protein
MSIQVSNVTTTGTAVYTSTGNTAITFLSICNYSGNTVTANLWVVPYATSVANVNKVLSSIELTGNGAAGGDTYQLYNAAEKLLLGPGDFIQVSANANAAVSVVTSYTTI